jgi:hypothetical protein
LATGSFQNLGKWLDDYKVTVSLLVSAVGLSVIKDLGEAVLDENLHWGMRAFYGSLVAATLLCAWYGTIGQAKLSNENRRLEEQVSAANELVQNFGSDYFALWDTRLEVLAEVLHFDARDRISVYRHTGNSFTMVGRFAPLPELDKPGRGVYPVDQGIIGAAWRSGDGKCVAQDLPDPILDLDAYCARSRDEWGLSIAVAKKLGMKSRSIAAFALNGHNNGVRDAVVVFESTDPERFAVEHLENHIKGTTGRDIAHLLKIMKEREPSLEFAVARGF